ncbi:peptidoglycan-binding protein [Roseomonas sp. BN140053]|uniref:NlpC/P60 family protein n=1 Tax=Roseomonas sp. BN140053 TaxID=3391898 RepID=UPI0039E74766
MQKAAIPGSNGVHVQSLQRALNASMNAGLLATGFYCPQTMRAVQAWQAKVGLPATGAFQFPAGGGMQGRDTPLRLTAADGKVPLWFDIATAEIGVEEIKGNGSSPRVLEYLQSLASHFKRFQWEAGMESDSTAWCACFVNWCLTQAGCPAGRDARAYHWKDYGIGLKETSRRLGAITVIKLNNADPGVTTSGCHVGFLAGWGPTTIKLLGGNQGVANKDKAKRTEGVTVSTFKVPANAQVLAYRWPATIRH